MSRIHALALSLPMLLVVSCSSSLKTAQDGIGGITGSTGGVAGGATGGVAGGSVGGVTGIDAGASGGIGAAGQAGTANGGTGGATLPACGSPSSSGGAPDVESCAYAADGTPVLASVSAPVTVTSVDQVAPGNCGFFYFAAAADSSTPSTKVVLQTADQQVWTVYLRIPGLTANTIQAGESFDLGIDGGVAVLQGDRQTITLAQNGKLVLFGHSGRWPELSTSGITVADAGKTCSVATCGFEHHAVSVVNGSATAQAHEGQTTQVGNLSFTLSRALVWVSGGPGCDASNQVSMGGLVVSP